MQQQPTVRPAWNPWPVSIITFFILAIIACGTFVAFCSRHPADLVAADYYEQEVRYQGQIDRLRHAQQNARTAMVRYDDASKLVSICLNPKLSKNKPAGIVQFYRPSATNLDRQFKLAPDDKGVQTIDASALLPGLWKVRVSWTVDEKEFFVDQRIVIR